MVNIIISSFPNTTSETRVENLRLKRNHPKRPKGARMPPVYGWVVYFLQNHPTVSSAIIGLIAGAVALSFLGIPTDVIPNSRYMRMVPASALDLFFLVSASALTAAYAGLSAYLYITKTKKEANKCGIGGTIGSFFAISCPTCIQLLVIVFGAAFLMKYYDPVRPFIGFLSIGLISYGIFRNVQAIRNKCHGCWSEAA